MQRDDSTDNDSTDLAQALQAVRAELADRPFGDTEGVSGRALQPFSRAGQEAAENLLGKALRAIHADARRA